MNIPASGLHSHHFARLVNLQLLAVQPLDGLLADIRHRYPPPLLSGAPTPPRKADISEAV